MEKREFREIIQEGVGTAAFSSAVYLRVAGLVLSVISTIIAIPDSMNPVGTVIGTLIGGLFTLFLVILPLFEILRAKNSQNFKNDCDFGLKYLRINTIITLVISVLFAIVSLLVMVAVDIKFIVLVILSGVMLAHSILQLEVINDIRNGLYYNIEKISYAAVYFALTVILGIGSVAYAVYSQQLLSALTELFVSASHIILAYLVFDANKKYK